MTPLKRCLAAMMSMFCRTAITIRPAIGAQASLTCFHRLRTADTGLASDGPSSCLRSRYAQYTDIAMYDSSDPR